MSFLLGLAMFGAMTFLPLYQQTVQHASPTVSGLLLIPMMLGSTVTSLISGRVTVRTGRYKALPIIGGAIMTVGMLLLAHLGPSTSRWTSMGFFLVFGIGMGFLMQITTLIAQNSVDPRDMGVASSSRAFFQQIGGSIGVSIFGAVFIRVLHSSMSSKLPGVALPASGNNINPQTVAHLPAPDAGRRVLQHRPRHRRGVPAGGAGRGDRVRARLADQGDPAARRRARARQRRRRPSRNSSPDQRAG